MEEAWDTYKRITKNSGRSQTQHPETRPLYIPVVILVPRKEQCVSEARGESRVQDQQNRFKSLTAAATTNHELGYKAVYQQEMKYLIIQLCRSLRGSWTSFTSAPPRLSFTVSFRTCGCRTKRGSVGQGFKLQMVGMGGVYEQWLINRSDPCAWNATFCITVQTTTVY